MPGIWDFGRWISEFGCVVGLIWNIKITGTCSATRGGAGAWVCLGGCVWAGVGGYAI